MAASPRGKTSRCRTMGSGRFCGVCLRRRRGGRRRRGRARLRRRDRRFAKRRGPVGFTPPQRAVRMTTSPFWSSATGADAVTKTRLPSRAMGRCGEVSRPDFVVSVGDNFYEGGLNAADDPEFAQSFTDVYTHETLQVPWHAILGNHDYGDCGYDESAGDGGLSPPCGCQPFATVPAGPARARDWRWSTTAAKLRPQAGRRRAPLLHRHQPARNQLQLETLGELGA